jgi:hypothetical protein
MRITRLIAVLGLIAVIVGLSPRLLAQTPVASDEPVVVTSVDGDELGTVAVEGVEDPFEGYMEGYEPEEGARFVMVTAAFEATGEATFDAYPYGFVLRDADGVHWSSTSIVREEAIPPDLQSQTLSPGNRISGVVGFQVPEDSEITDVYYQPESTRLIHVLALEERAGPALGDEVTYTSLQTEGAEGIAIVDDLEDPFEDLAEGYEPAEDSRYVVMTVSFESTGTGVLDADPYDLILRDTDGFLWSFTTVAREEGGLPELQAQLMSPGNRISGVVAFQVPEDAELAQLYWQPESGHLVELADFEAEGDGTDAGVKKIPGAADPATPAD